MVAHAHSPSTWEAGLEAPGHPLLAIELEADLGHVPSILASRNAVFSLFLVLYPNLAPFAPTAGLKESFSFKSGWNYGHKPPLSLHNCADLVPHGLLNCQKSFRCVFFTGFH